MLQAKTVVYVNNFVVYEKLSTRNGSKVRSSYKRDFIKAVFVVFEEGNELTASAAEDCCCCCSTPSKEWGGIVKNHETSKAGLFPKA